MTAPHGSSAIPTRHAGCHFRSRLGPIPDLRCGWLPAHTVLHHYKGDILKGSASWTCYSDKPGRLWLRSHREAEKVANDAGDLVGGDLVGKPRVFVGHPVEPPVARAYSAARSARFEHGQSGAT